MVNYLDTEKGRRLAYHKCDGEGLGVMFLGGFMSDMEGTKATHLEEWAKKKNTPYVRFDYSGHGQSSGRFEDGAIGDWVEDAASILNQCADAPQILVGSSMGAWIASLLIRAYPQKIAGFVGIAAAPDFTEDAFWAEFTDDEKAELMKTGVVNIPSDYGEPYPITKRLIEEGRNHLILRSPLTMAFPVRLLHGTNDTVVPVERQLKLMEHIKCDDIRLTLVKGEDHSFSSPRALRMIEKSIHSIIKTY